MGHRHAKFLKNLDMNQVKHISMICTVTTGVEAGASLSCQASDKALSVNTQVPCLFLRIHCNSVGDHHPTIGQLQER